MEGSLNLKQEINKIESQISNKEQISTIDLALIYNLCDKFGFPRKGMHSLRKYYATKLINAGVEEIIVISQMGHTDFKTTKTFYYSKHYSAVPGQTNLEIF